MQLTLRREAHFADGTIGVLEVQGRKFLTLELRAGGEGADKHDTCLPPGTYRLTPVQRAGGERCYTISNPALGVWQRPSDVPRTAATDARSAVFLAAGFGTDDLVGCHVAVGKGRSKVRGAWQVEDPRGALNEVRTLIGGAFDVTLTVEEPL